MAEISVRSTQRASLRLSSATVTSLRREQHREPAAEIRIGWRIVGNTNGQPERVFNQAIGYLPILHEKLGLRSEARQKVSDPALVAPLSTKLGCEQQPARPLPALLFGFGGRRRGVQSALQCPHVRCEDASMA